MEDPKTSSGSIHMSEKKHDAGQAHTAPASIFTSVSKEEFDRLPRPTEEDIRRALDEGRPDERELGAGALPRLDPTLRFF
jgi:hypothetical protein